MLTSALHRRLAKALGSQLVLLSREAWRIANSPTVGVEGSEAIGGKGADALVKMHSDVVTAAAWEWFWSAWRQR
jgi:hypothetical protein